MERSFRVSKEGLKRAKEAFQRTGWTQEYLAGSANCTRQTVNKFFARGLIEKRLFGAICTELKLELEEIADLEWEEEQSSKFLDSDNNMTVIIEQQKTTDEDKLAYAIAGSVSKVDIPKLKAIVALLQKITGDTSIEIVDIEQGSIKLILEGSQQSLEQLEALFKAGQLTEVLGILVQDVQFVTRKSSEADEDIKGIEKKRLVFTITGNISEVALQELKAVLIETQVKKTEKLINPLLKYSKKIINFLLKYPRKLISYLLKYPKKNIHTQLKYPKKNIKQFPTRLTAITEVLDWFEQLYQPSISVIVWHQCTLALAEGFTNAVRYAHRDLPLDVLIEIEVTLFSNSLEIRIWDQGPLFNDELAKGVTIDGLAQGVTIDELTEGLTSLQVLQKMTDKFSYTRTDDNRNCLLICRKL